MRRNYQILAALGLIFVTAVWGSTFFLIKNLLDHMTAINFLGIRFLLAGVVVGIIFIKRLLRAALQTWIHGGILGAIYACAQVLQTVGLKYTDASVSGFITGMYVVLTPIIVWLIFKERIAPITVLATLVATAGLMILSLKGFAFGFGELITFSGSVLYALHIVVLGSWVKKDNALTLAVIQIMSIGVLCFGAAFPMGIALPTTTGQWASLLYMALIAGVGTLVIQTWAQGHIDATRAAIIMTMEPVFAAGFAILFGGESITWRLLIGGSFVLIAMFATELWSVYRIRRSNVYKRSLTVRKNRKEIIDAAQ